MISEQVSLLTSRERRRRRVLFVQACSGDLGAFISLFGLYTDLLNANLYLAGYSCVETRKGLLQGMACQLWERMPFLPSFLAFERLIAMSAQAIPYNASGVSDEAFTRLDSIGRLLMAAREWESWPIPVIAMASSKSVVETRTEILLYRCRLTQTPYSRFDAPMRSVLAELSEAFDRNTACSSRRINQITAQYPELRAFESAWLERRCELIDLRESVRLGSEAKEALLNRLSEALSRQPQKRLTVPDQLARAFKVPSRRLSWAREPLTAVSV